MIKQNCENCPFKDFGYVPPELKPNSDILFVGQNPGQEELKIGYPFCHKGNSGKLLRSYIEELDKKGLIYSITNALKCGTPNNKTPTPKQVQVCIDKLQEDIKFTTPKLIVALGKPALTALTGLKTGILKLNGHILRQYNPPIAVCVHPSFVNRRGRDLKIFEKGILPALKYFDKEIKVEYKEVITILPTEEEIGFDIETDSLQPHLGKIKCFSVSDGNTALFVEIEE